MKLSAEQDSFGESISFHLMITRQELQAAELPLRFLLERFERPGPISGKVAWLWSITGSIDALQGGEK